MEIFYHVKTINWPCVIVLLGKFDGCHLGHQKLFKLARQLKQETGAKILVITFSPYPEQVLTKGIWEGYLQTPMEKFLFLKQQGIDGVLVFNFTLSFSKMTRTVFIDLLTKHLKILHIVVGYDFCFGYKGGGDVVFLEEIGRKYNFKVHKVMPIKLQQQIISTTFIKFLLKQGYLQTANQCLGYSFVLIEKVRPGEKRGRTLGFPTANIFFPGGKFLPKQGVYAVLVQIGTKYFKGMCNFGVRPTFKDNRIRLEVHLFNFEADIYDKQIAVYLQCFLRDTQKFSSVRELTEQLFIDKENSLHLLANISEENPNHTKKFK